MVFGIASNIVMIARTSVSLALRPVKNGLNALKRRVSVRATRDVVHAEEEKLRNGGVVIYLKVRLASSSVPHPGVPVDFSVLIRPQARA